MRRMSWLPAATLCAQKRAISPSPSATLTSITLPRKLRSLHRERATPDARAPWEAAAARKSCGSSIDFKCLSPAT